MFKSTKALGKPGPVKRYEVPEGFTLYQYHSTSPRSFDGWIIRGDSETGGGSLELLDNNPGAYEDGDVKIWIEKLRGAEASRSWSAAGSNPRMYCDYKPISGRYEGDMLSLEDEDPYIESATCDEADIQISSVSLPVSGLHISSVANVNFVPSFRMTCFFRDAPGSRNQCYSSYLTRCKILVRNSRISEVRSNLTRLLGNGPT